MSPQETTEPALKRLIGEINGEEVADPDADPAAKTEAIVDETSKILFDGHSPEIDDSRIKESLPELLMVLIALRQTDAHGKGIMEDLNRFFGAQLSPGTVYPMLHDLDDEGLLEMRELIQTKEYAVDDEAAVEARLQDAMRQHLTLGLVFQRALEEFETTEE